MTVRELTAFLGFEVDDGALKKFDAELSAVKAECAALSERLKVAEQTAAEALEGMKSSANSAAAALGETGTASENITETENAAVKAAEALSGVKENASNAASALEETSTGAKHLGNTNEAAEKSAKALGGVKDNAEKSTKAFDGMKKKAGEAGGEIEKTKKKADSLATSLNKIAKIVGGIFAVGKIISFGKSILDTTGEVEQYRVTLGTMIGDQEKANKIIHDLDYSPVSDFYGTAAAIGGLQGMVTFGMQAEEASDTLTRLGDIAQGNGEAFKSLSLNMGQVFAKGKADATDLKQFVGQGFDVVGEVAAMTGKSRAEIEKAGVSYEQCAAALKHITSEGGKYNGMLDKQSRTLPGLIKQFQSLSAAIKESIGTAVLDKVKALMQHFLDLGRAMQDNIVAAGTRAFEAVLRGIADVIIFLDVLKIRMKKFGGAFTPIKGIVNDVAGFVASALQSLAPLFMGIAQAVLLAFKPIQAFVQPVLESFKPILRNVFQFAADLVEQLLPIIDGLTPVFGYVGDAVAAVFNKLEPIIKTLGGAVLAVTGRIKDVLFPVILALEPLVSAVISLVLDGLDAVAGGTSVLAKIIGALAPVISIVGKIAGAAVSVLANGLAVILPILSPIIKILVPIAGIIMGIVAAIKVWTAVQAVLNAVMAMNPIALIIIGIVALIGIIVLLVKHWDKAAAKVKELWSAVKDFFKGFGSAAKSAASVFAAIIAPIPTLVIGAIKSLIKNWDAVKSALIKGVTAVGGFFQKTWLAVRNAFTATFNGIAKASQKVLGGIKKAWGAIKSFFSRLWSGIVDAAKHIWGGITGFFTALIEGIKSVWGGITEFFFSLWTGIVSAAESVLSSLAGFFGGLIEKIKGIWSAITDFFSALWGGIISAATGAWNGIAGLFQTVIGQVKEAWGGITDFFGGLWDALKESPLEALRFIKDSFLGLFDGIKERFFGFIGSIKEGWDKVKGFFGGLWDGAVNFVPGGKDEEPAKPRKVNDLILTPDGTYSTHPDDTIFAMKDPGILIDRIADLLSRAGQKAPYALSGGAASQVVRQSVSNDYSTHSSSQTINAPVRVTVNAGGMSAEQARRVVEIGVRGALRDAIAGSRGVIPSPEARRA